MTLATRRDSGPIRLAPRIAVCCTLVFLLAGCTHTWTPSQAPPISLHVVGPLKEGLSVDLINHQPETQPTVFASVGAVSHAANYNEFTDFFIRYWGDELVKRNVAVTNQSPNKILVKVDSFAMIVGFAKVRANMSIHLQSPDAAWKRDLDETDTSGWNFGRAVGSLIYHAVEKMLEDPEILARMKPPGRAN